MNVQHNKGNGLKSTTAGGFTLQDSSVTGNGDAAGESGLNFSGLTGTATIARSTVSGSRENNLVVRNSSGTLNLVVSNSTFSNTSNTSDGNDGILLDLTGTATVNPTISGSTFSANKGDHFQFAATNSAGGNVVFRQNTLNGGHASALAQDLLIGASGTGYNGSVTYDIDNNTINGAVLSAITTNLTGQTATGATMVGKVRNNRIGTTGQGFSCSQQANGITFNANGSGTHTASVTNNTIRNCAQRGISATANYGSGNLNLTVTGNTVAELIDPNPADGNPWGLQGFLLSAGGAGPTDSNSVCLALGDATTAALKNSLTFGPPRPISVSLVTSGCASKTTRPSGCPATPARPRPTW